MRKSVIRRLSPPMADRRVALPVDDWEWLEGRRAETGESIASQIRRAVREFREREERSGD